MREPLLKHNSYWQGKNIGRNPQGDFVGFDPRSECQAGVGCKRGSQIGKILSVSANRLSFA